MVEANVGSVRSDVLVSKGDFVEIKFTGFSDGKVFDSNIPEDLALLSSEAKPQKTVVCVGERMVVDGLDNALSGKALNEEFVVEFGSDEGFGPRRKDLVRTIPLKVFSEHKIVPRPGASLLLDNQLVRVITVSGARVITDFNNPLAGKSLRYKCVIFRKVLGLVEKSEAFFGFFLRFKPDFEVSQDKGEVIVKGPAVFEQIIVSVRENFERLVGAKLSFSLSEELGDSKS